MVAQGGLEAAPTSRLCLMNRFLENLQDPPRVLRHCEFFLSPAAAVLAHLLREARVIDQ